MAETLEKCICGKKPAMYVGSYGAFYRCDKCGKKAPASWDTEKAAGNWNKMIKKEKKAEK